MLKIFQILFHFQLNNKVSTFLQYIIISEMCVQIKETGESPANQDLLFRYLYIKSVKIKRFQNSR